MVEDDAIIFLCPWSSGGVVILRCRSIAGLGLDLRDMNCFRPVACMNERMTHLRVQESRKKYRTFCTNLIIAKIISPITE